MNVVSYKCPCCASALSYSGNSGKLECASCGNSFSVEDLDALKETGATEKIEFALPKEEFGADDAREMRAYVCENCGAELITDENTSATACAYCGSPAILPDRIEGGVKPEIVVPFKISKEQAAKMFEEYFQGKRMLPKVFLNSSNRIAEMRKLYLPYYLFDCDAEADMVYDAETSSTSREGDWEVTRTDHYLIRRAGGLGFDAIPVDASVKMNDEITESLEPYDLCAAVPFQPAVLSGALADNADADADACERRAIERVEESVRGAMLESVTGYDSVTMRSERIRSANAKAKAALMPIWLITTEKQENGEKKTYTFAINGQTGELTCDVPFAKGKAAGWFAGIFLGVAALGYGVMVLLNVLGVFA